jgi:hypothetical protein
MGGDMSSGKALTAKAAAAMILSSITRKSAYSYFPLSLGLGVRISQILPPRLYDRFMERMFRRLPIARVALQPPRPERT